MKRAYVDSDFEEDEGFNQEKCLDGEEDETKARKKRRGLIEKKRRDRINSCLTELRRLVPAAVDKQGSAKLEKAEILQLTVEHLRNLRTIAKHDAVLKTTDVRAVGFRECLNEVTSYLYNYQDCKQEHKGQLLSHLNTVISPRPNVSDHACQSSVWPLTTRRVAEKETTCSYERTLLPLNHFKQQNPCLPTDNSATRNLHRVPLVTDIQNNKQLASHFTLFPVYNDNAMRFVGFPFTPR